MELIDKAAVVAEIEDIESSALCDYKSNKSRYAEGSLDVAHRVKNFLNTLKVKDVKLDEEISLWVKNLHSVPNFEELNKFARHFFELGLKVQKA